MWYVVQVFTGREDRTCSFIRQVAEEHLEECFVPRYRVDKWVDGAMETSTPVLFPGYLIVSTHRVEQLAKCLHDVPEFTRMLSVDGEFVPLEEGEKAWIDAFTQREHRTVEMSEGYLEGDRVVVTSGPLVSREGLIRKINHRKKTARLEVQMLGRNLSIEVGLRVVRKRN